MWLNCFPTISEKYFFSFTADTRIKITQSLLIETITKKVLKFNLQYTEKGILLIRFVLSWDISSVNEISPQLYFLSERRIHLKQRMKIFRFATMLLQEQSKTLRCMFDVGSKTKVCSLKASRERWTFCSLTKRIVLQHLCPLFFVSIMTKPSLSAFHTTQLPLIIIN